MIAGIRPTTTRSPLPIPQARPTAIASSAITMIGMS
jgi:hypothetical protein